MDSQQRQIEKENEIRREEKKLMTHRNRVNWIFVFHATFSFCRREATFVSFPFFLPFVFVSISLIGLTSFKWIQRRSCCSKSIAHNVAESAFWLWISCHSGDVALQSIFHFIEYLKKNALASNRKQDDCVCQRTKRFDWITMLNAIVLANDDNISVE